MRKTILIIVTTCITVSSTTAQRLHVGLFGGVSAYNGDLTESVFPKKVSNGVIGITANYELTDQVIIRSGLSYTVLAGADRYNKDAQLRQRNLSFETSLTELSLIGEYYLRNLYTYKLSPYVFAGVAAFHYNPYTYDASGQRIFLKPLGTEGQGIAGYPAPYKLTQFALPLGGGIKYAINYNWRIGLELGFRKLFTDYLDDVSGNYADEAELLAGNGQQAVEFSYRADDAGGSFFYPDKGAQRGSPKYKDIYYFGGLHLTYRLNSSRETNPLRMKRNSCPANIY